MKTILLTGGGTAGHVTPNVALLPSLQQAGYHIAYVGSQNGIEKELMNHCNIPYYPISSGKLRRYLSAKNITDAFRVMKGFSDALSLVKKLKPDILFSKGGFVSVPVVLACKQAKVPIVIHESDMTPGLANKISLPFADKICVTFPETIGYLPPKKAILTGSPIREELSRGSKIAGQKLCGFFDHKPVVLVMGGSLGAVAINNCIRQALPQLLPTFNVVHICGKNNEDFQCKHTGYKQFPYVSDSLKDLFALADVVVSRAGSNSICEFLFLKKPSLLIPLTKKASRGDQILNANSFAAQGFSKVLPEEEMTVESLIAEVINMFSLRHVYWANMNKSSLGNGVLEVMKVILSATKK